MTIRSPRADKKRRPNSHLVPMVHASWAADSTNRGRAPADKLKPAELWERLGL